jgi:ABC-type antimicrobial peptide transport system permease subunit
MSSAIAGILVLDPAVFPAVGLVLAIVSSVAAYVPARRSLRLDPAKDSARFVIDFRRGGFFS